LCGVSRFSPLFTGSGTMSHPDHEFGGDGEAGPWPAFADLLSATTLLFLVLFAAIAVPALQRLGASQARETTLRMIETTLTQRHDSSVSVLRVGDHLLVRIRGDATFPLDHFELATLKPEGRRILREFGASVESDSSLLDKIDEIQVVGHTSREGSDERNWVLSASRAATVALFLIQDVHIPPCKVSALGRSRFYPVGPELRDSVNPSDRRIELEIRPIVPGDTVQERRRKSCVSRNS
jgi:outer membrane protein OmpA-like peptidoglycan-associated protein